MKNSNTRKQAIISSWPNRNNIPKLKWNPRKKWTKKYALNVHFGICAKSREFIWIKLFFSHSFFYDFLSAKKYEFSKPNHINNIFLLSVLHAILVKSGYPYRKVVVKLKAKTLPRNEYEWWNFVPHFFMEFIYKYGQKNPSSWPS